jgi:hypothetical protein
MIQMKYVLTSVSLVFLGLTVACGGGSASTNNDPSAQIRVMQGSPDLGSVDIFVNGQILTSNLSWRNVFPIPTTSYSSVQAGSTHFQEFPTGTTSSALVETHLPLSANTFYTVLTVGEQSTGSLATLVLTDDHSDSPSGYTRTRLVHGASSIGTVDVYFTTAPTDPVPASPTIPAFTYKSASTYVAFAGGNAELCVNHAGTIPASMRQCLLSVQFVPSTGPLRKNANTIVMLDPDLSAGGTGNFTFPVAIGAMPY